MKKQRTIKQSRIAELVISAVCAAIFGTLAALEYGNPPAFYFFLAISVAALGSTVNDAIILIKNRNKKGEGSK